MRGRTWKLALAVVSLAALAIAVYFQFSGRGEADRLVAARMDQALAESRARVEILERHRAEMAKEAAAEQDGNQPLPDAVLRRGESGGGSALRQVRDRDEREAALTRLQEGLDDLAIRMERSDQALRQDLQAIRAEAHRERAASGKILLFLGAALAVLILHLLISSWPPASASQG